MSQLIGDEQLDQVELDLLELLLHDYGFDYRGASVEWLRQKLSQRVVAEQLQTLRGLREKLLADEGCRQRLLRSLLLNASAMFQEPALYRGFRAMVVPLLRTYPFVRIWHVGCATGEEVYSLAILLEEEGLYERCRIYATDSNEANVRAAREGIYPLAAMREYTANYVRAGGRSAFSEYYTARYEHAIFRHSLRRNVLFAQHDLATDGPFNEFQVVVCRGVLPLLGPAVRQRAGLLFRESLVRLGFLCLSGGESMAALGASATYEPFVRGGIYRRMG